MNYRDDEILIKALELIREGKTEEEIQKVFYLSEDDLDLLDFVFNEF